MSMPITKTPTAYQLSRAKKVVLGTWYTCVDYEGNDLPVAVAPFNKERGSAFYVCVNHLGGHVWVKAEEFRPLTSVNKKRITSRAKAELLRQVGA
jgi:hypothetical protein